PAISAAGSPGTSSMIEAEIRLTSSKTGRATSRRRRANSIMPPAAPPRGPRRRAGESVLDPHVPQSRDPVGHESLHVRESRLLADQVPELQEQHLVVDPLLELAEARLA